MGKRDRRWHQLWRLVAGIAKHQPLIAGTDYAIGTADALGNIGGLVIESNLDFTAVRIDSGISIAVANIT